MQSRDGLVEALRNHLGDESKASTKFQLQLGIAPWPAPAYRVIYLGTGGLDVDGSMWIPRISRGEGWPCSGTSECSMSS